MQGDIKDLLLLEFDIDELTTIYWEWEAEPLLYGWLNGYAGKITKVLKDKGYDIDSITVVQDTWAVLNDIV